MKCWIVIISLLCLSAAAYANPIIAFDPISNLAYVLVLGAAVVVEAGIVTLILMFWGIEIKPAYIALITGNLMIYLVIFLPLLELTPGVWFAEIGIVILDACLIKMLTLFDTYRGDTFFPLKWPYAIIIATLGNLVSYYVGVATTS